MRELLPELLDDALGEGDRGRVEAHLAGCSACAEELALLRSARAVMRAVSPPRIDTAAIVAALPRPTRVHSPSPVARRSPHLFRLAAAVSFISLGGISLAVVRSYFSAPSVGVVDSVAANQAESLRTAPPLAVADGAEGGTTARGVSLHPSLTDLDDADLESLLAELEELEAAPMAEPETTPGGRAIAGAIIGS